MIAATDLLAALPPAVAEHVQTLHTLVAAVRRELDRAHHVPFAGLVQARRQMLDAVGSVRRAAERARLAEPERRLLDELLERVAERAVSLPRLGRAAFS